MKPVRVVLFVLGGILLFTISLVIGYVISMQNFQIIDLRENQKHQEVVPEEFQSGKREEARGGDCFKARMTEKGVMIAGKVLTVSDDENWYSIKLEVCLPESKATAPVANIVIPKDVRRIDKGSINDHGGVWWSKELTSDVINSISNSDVLMAEIELYGSKGQFLQQFEGIDGFDCEFMDQCREYVKFFDQYETDQLLISGKLLDLMNDKSGIQLQVLDGKHLYTTAIFVMSNVDEFRRLINEGQL